MSRDPSKYFVDGVRWPSVTEVLSFSGWSRFDHVDPEILRRAAERGTLVHEATEQVDEGTFDWVNLREDLHGYIRAFEKFKNDYKYSVLKSEEVVLNHQYCFGGQYDRLCELDGELTILDVKTSSKPSVSWGLQTAAYALAAPEDIQKRVTLRLGDGNYDLNTWASPDDSRNFLDALKVVWAQVRAGVQRLK